MCFELNIFHKTSSMDKSTLRNFEDCYQNRAPSQTFCGDKLNFKNFKKLPLVENDIAEL